MRSITINIGEDDLRDLKEIFKNEANFQPQVRQDHLIIAILKQVLESSKSQDESGS